MEAIEISAATLDAAKKQAADKLGVSVEQLAVTVLEESKGLFGKGSVRIRAEAGGEAPAAKPKRGAKAAKVEKSEPEAAVAVAEPEEKPAKKGRGKAKAEEAPPAEAVVETPAAAPVEVVASKADAEALLGLLNGVLKAGDLEVTAKIEGLNGRYVNLTIDGKDAGHLVGKQGEVINALQYLLNIIANQQIGNGVRATLDGNDYRRRREAALTKLANSIADQVVARGEEAVLDALPAFERRIVHKALSENSKISTYSEGEEPNRRVVIAPAD
ncbi:MAG TPA: RNA-binding cell elongation regulator Jag/EloR [Fimbriimonadaceae bacterium]|nr:RNA-binding cell elongation regulator Jag/EloR [Fimbriimonadaceae bacterium]